MHVILGLGNPGAEYELTRHNIGFMAVNALAEKHGIKFDRKGHHCVYGLGKIANREVLAAKPMTYMNESGKAARAVLAAFDMQSERLMVIHDDIDLALAKSKKKKKGGDAGQRGIRSIMQRLETDLFTRIRVGVGRPEHGDVVDYVLSNFKKNEFPLVNEILEQVALKIETALKEPPSL